MIFDLFMTKRSKIMNFDLLARKRSKIRIKSGTYDLDLTVRSIDALERSKIKDHWY